MAHICDLPAELLSDILSLALLYHSIPSDVLRVDTRFRDVGQLCLYSHLRFRRRHQIASFAETTSPLACIPRRLTIDIRLGSGASSAGAAFSVFRLLVPVLERCGAHSAETSGTGQLVQLPLTHFELFLNTHVRDLDLRCVYDALSLTNPKRFVWRGSDLDHYLSVAIVPIATSHVLRAAATWTEIQEITLTNLAFPTRDAGLDTPERPLLPAMPNLRRLTLDRATMLPPERVANMVCLAGQDQLEVHLIDAYSDSIWGPRVRRSDIEKVVFTKGSGDCDALVSRIRQTVRCEAKTERIMGGDRAKGISILD